MSAGEQGLGDQFDRLLDLANALDSSEVHIIVGRRGVRVCVGTVEGNGASLLVAMINARRAAVERIAQRLDDANEQVRMLVETLTREEVS